MSGVTVTGSSSPRLVASRLATLAQAVERTREGRRVDVRQIMLVAGATFMGLGFVAIVLGWYGAAHSAYLFQEVPYLISGGLLGVALVAGGGFLFFAAWLVRLIEDNRRAAARVAETLDRVDRALAVMVRQAATSSDGHGAARPDSPPRSAGASRRGDGFDGGWT